MAKRGRQQIKKEPAELPLRTQKHIASLGFGWKPEDYLRWCADNGFRKSMEKSIRECQEEARACKRQQEWTRELTRLHRNPKKFIDRACAGTIDADRITRPLWAHICRRIIESKPDADSRSSLRKLLHKITDEADFLTESVTFGDHTYRYIDAIVRMNSRRDQWIRPLASWRVKSHNMRRQFSSLLRHLFARYPIPLFMDSAWFRGESGSHQMRDWFIHIGSGENIRTAQTPIPLTKRMAHHFSEAPDDYTIENALRWGQVHAMGGDRRLTEAILGTRIGDSFENESFWVTVIRFLIDNPLLDRRHVGPVVDFLAYQKYEIQEVLVGPGIVEQQEPPHPNLTMRGRNPGSLLRQVERWHTQLGRSEPAAELFFKRSGIGDFDFKKERGKKQRWKIRELLSGHQLVSEGKSMHHCVATYANSCARGHCSIWAMELHTSEGKEKRQTVEVNRHGVIVESRGKLNRLPTIKEYNILKRWADQEGLTISRYVIPDN